MSKSNPVFAIAHYFKSVNRLSLSIAVLCTLFSLNTYSQETDKERIKSLEQRLLELERQVQKQNKQNSAIAVEAKNNEAANDTEPFVIPKSTQRPSRDFEAPDKSIVLSTSDTTLQLGGQIWLDAIYNNGEMTNRAGFQTSSIAYEENTTKDNTLFHVGPSNLFVKSFTPTQYGAMTTRFEFDLFDSQGNSGINLTHIWGEIGSFGAGQTFTGFMDINAFPNILDFWGPNSMVFARQPQVRYSTNINKHSRLIVTIEKADSDFAVPKNSNSSGYDDITELPDFTASYIYSDDFGYIKSAMIVRKLGYETVTTKDTAIGWGLNISGNVTLTTEDSVQFQLAHGEGIGRYINDTCCSYYSDETGGIDGGLDQNGNLTAIPVTAGYLYYNKQWNKKWSSTIGYSYLTVDNLATQKDKALKNSTYTSTNLIWYPTNQVKAGIELLYGDVQSNSGLEADNYRVQMSVGFKY